MTPEQARDLARQKLAAVARGEDPSAERHAARAGMTVAEICDWYLEQARAARPGAGADQVSAKIAELLNANDVADSALSIAAE